MKKIFYSLILNSLVLKNVKVESFVQCRKNTRCWQMQQKQGGIMYWRSVREYSGLCIIETGWRRESKKSLTRTTQQKTNLIYFVKCSERKKHFFFRLKCLQPRGMLFVAWQLHRDKFNSKFNSVFRWCSKNSFGVTTVWV